MALLEKKACIINFFVIVILSLPCALEFNIWSGFQPLGAGTGVLDLEDFIVSTTLLPLGSMIFLIFCCSERYGWGFKKFTDKGKGPKFPVWSSLYVSYILPFIVLFIFIQGYITTFSNL
ncbi:MAG: hypothetical protein JJE21_10710 [Spirochaetaceae bacterium]|nr:hypothetical protein [Spirochaetaceae bacterium]